MTNKHEGIKIHISDLISEIEDIRELKAKKNGDVTVKELLLVLLNELNSGEIEDLIVVRKYKDGEVASGWTSPEGIDLFGLVEVLKLHISASLTEWIYE